MRLPGESLDELNGEASAWRLLARGTAAMHELILSAAGANRLASWLLDASWAGGGSSTPAVPDLLTRRNASWADAEALFAIDTLIDALVAREVHDAGFYAGAAHGRFRCLGGTSTRWGGAMLPYLPSDLRERWPLDYGALARYAPEIELLFALPPGAYDLPDLVSTNGAATYLPRLAKWPSFAKRNVAHLLTRELASPQGPDVWLNAHVGEFKLGEGGKLEFCALVVWSF